MLTPRRWSAGVWDLLRLIPGEKGQERTGVSERSTLPSVSPPDAREGSTNLGMLLTPSVIQTFDVSVAFAFHLG